MSVLTQSYHCGTWFVCSFLLELAVSSLGQPLFCLSITWSRCRNAYRDLWIMTIEMIHLFILLFDMISKLNGIKCNQIHWNPKQISWNVFPKLNMWNEKTRFQLIINPRQIQSMVDCLQYIRVICSVHVAVLCNSMDPVSRGISSRCLFSHDVQLFFYCFDYPVFAYIISSQCSILCYVSV